jgi:16S rRNA C967 or C1407 C5-methylase (RsmB/RsmF family)
MEPEENENVVDEVLKTRGYVSRVIRARAADSLRDRIAEGVDAHSLFGSAGYFRTSPHVHHTDGFFAAIIERAKT